VKVSHAVHGGEGSRFDYAAQGIEIDLGDGRKILIAQNAQDGCYELPEVRIQYGDSTDPNDHDLVDVQQVIWVEQQWYPKELYPGNDVT
jgi:hypothetical protein